MKHLLATEGLDATTATAVLDTAEELKRTLLGREVRKLPTLRGRTVITMFYESVHPHPGLLRDRREVDERGRRQRLRAPAPAWARASRCGTPRSRWRPRARTA